MHLKGGRWGEEEEEEEEEDEEDAFKRGKVGG